LFKNPDFFSFDIIYQMSTPEYDEYLLETSSAGAQETPMAFKSRSKITINDSNQGSYSSGQITWDLSQLANSTNMPDLKSGYLRIPVFDEIVGSDRNRTTQC
jgi:hypothetical protein